MKIEELKEELRIAREDRDQAISKVTEIERSLAQAKAEKEGIIIGDKVRDRQGQLWVVEDIDLFGFNDTVEYKGRLIRKNGDLGKNLLSIFRNPITKVQD